MRRGYFFFISLLTLCIFSASGQTLGNLKFQLPPLADRYKLDYEIEGIVAVTPEMLENLDLDKYEALRQTDTDIEVYDEFTGYHITLYAVNRAIDNYNRSLKNREDED